MNEVGTWVAVVGAGGGVSVITFITFWMTLSSRITEAQERAHRAEDAAKSSQGFAANAMLKAEQNAESLNLHRIESAAKISALQAVSETTARSLAQSETRLAKSIEDLGEKMDKLGESVIKTLGSLAAFQQRGREDAR